MMAKILTMMFHARRSVRDGAVHLTAVAEAGAYASDEISLAATASHLTAAEVASDPTAEQLVEVAAEPLSFEKSRG